MDQDKLRSELWGIRKKKNRNRESICDFVEGSFLEEGHSSIAHTVTKVANEGGMSSKSAVIFFASEMHRLGVKKI